MGCESLFVSLGGGSLAKRHVYPAMLLSRGSAKPDQRGLIDFILDKFQQESQLAQGGTASLGYY